MLTVRSRTSPAGELVVGTLLSVVNLGELLRDGATGPGTWVRMGINSLVPFFVASYGFLSARSVRPTEPAVPMPRRERRRAAKTRGARP